MSLVDVMWKQTPWIQLEIEKEEWHTHTHTETYTHLPLSHWHSNTFIGSSTLTVPNRVVSHVTLVTNRCVSTPKCTHSLQYFCHLNISECQGSPISLPWTNGFFVFAILILLFDLSVGPCQDGFLEHRVWSLSVYFISLRLFHNIELSHVLELVGKSTVVCVI
jgi:hypothetical protein